MTGAETTFILNTFSFLVWGALVWRAMDFTMGARVSRQVELLGQDAGELGIEAYPEFVLMPEEDSWPKTTERRLCRDWPGD